MVVSDKNPAGWTPGPSPLGLLSGTGLSGHQGRGRTGPPPMGPTQHPIPGGPPSLRPTAPSPAWTHSALPAEGVSAPRRHSTDPGLPAPADFPWREEHELLRKWGPGQQAASEQPCPALPGVQSCHGLWVSVGCPGLGGGWGLEGAGGWRGSRTPPPESSSARPRQAVPLAWGCPATSPSFPCAEHSGVCQASSPALSILWTPLRTTLSLGGGLGRTPHSWVVVTTGSWGRAPQLRKQANLPKMPAQASRSRQRLGECLWHKIIHHILTVYLELVLNLRI